MGSVSGDQVIQRVCADSLSFLVTHRIVYRSLELDEEDPTKSEWEFYYLQILNSEPEIVLDAIMYLSGSESKYIRATAFSTLSSLAQYSSKDKTVMCQIQRDIDFPTDSSSSGSMSSNSSIFENKKSESKKQAVCYYEYITERLKQQHVEFEKVFSTKDIEEYYSGLYTLIRLAQEPITEEIAGAVDHFIRFIGFVQGVQEKIIDFINAENESESLSDASDGSSSRANSKISQSKIDFSKKEIEMLETVH